MHCFCYLRSGVLKLIAEPDSFTLPRKFKIAFSNSESDTGYAAFNDLGFVARIKEGKRGFRVFLGGSLGSKPMVGYELFDFAPEEDIFYITDAAKKFFSRYGNRKNKHKARLRYVFYKLGKEEVFRLFFEIYHEIKQTESISYTHQVFPHSPKIPLFGAEKVSIPEFQLWKKRYTKEQAQTGYSTVVVPFEHGNISHDILGKFADFASHFGDDTVRFSMRQNIHLRNIPNEYLGNVYNFLSKIGVATHVPLLLNTLVSCTGADTCRLGICLTKGATHALSKALSKSDLDLDQLSDLRINLSGCPNSCGQQIAADLGFYGKVSRNNRMYPAYHIVAGASAGSEPKLAELVGEVSAYDLPKFSVDLFRTYLSKQEKFNSFSAYVSSEGKTDIAELTSKYKIIPDFSEDKNYYFDWGAEQIFSLAAKGVGECSAGLFDMIDVDLNSIVSIKKRLGEATDPDEINTLLYQLVFASSRMLLITRGAEPRNENEVFNEFLARFIDAKLVSSVFREIVEIARDNSSFNFLEKQETILDLSQAIVGLYEGMDDSLQFKPGENNALKTEIEVPSSGPAIARKKDFRGVACPMNFVKTKVELATLRSGDILEILLDNGEPIENVPGSIKAEGHDVLDIKQIEEYWQVSIRKR